MWAELTSLLLLPDEGDMSVNVLISFAYFNTEHLKQKNYLEDIQKTKDVPT